MVWPGGRQRYALKASSYGWVAVFLGGEERRAASASPAAGRGNQLVPWGTSNSCFLPLSFLCSFSLTFLHQSHELVQHCKENYQLLRMQCLKTHSHCVLVERPEEKLIKGYWSAAFFMISPYIRYSAPPAQFLPYWQNSQDSCDVLLLMGAAALSFYQADMGGV